MKKKKSLVLNSLSKFWHNLLNHCGFKIEIEKKIEFKKTEKNQVYNFRPWKQLIYGVVLSFLH